MTTRPTPPVDSTLPYDALATARKSDLAEIETAEVARRPRPSRRDRKEQREATADALAAFRSSMARWSR